jgi:hypothetical protein
MVLAICLDALQNKLGKFLSLPVMKKMDGYRCVLGERNSFLNKSHRSNTRDAPDIRPDIPAFLISGIRPDTKLVSRISSKAGYRISGRISG